MRRKLPLIVLGLGLAAASRAATFTVTIAPGGSLTFSPASQTINVGDTVHWVWAASGHSTTSGNSCTSDGRWDSGVQSTGFTFDVTFPTAGTFNYYCSVHCGLGMTGTIIVAPPPTPTLTPTPGPAGAVPALSPPLLGALGIALAIAALFVLRRR